MRVTGVHPHPLVLLVPLQLAPRERDVPVESREAAARAGVSPGAGLAAGPPGRDRPPSAPPPPRRLVDERLGTYVAEGDVVGGQAARAVLHQQLRALGVCD